MADRPLFNSSESEQNRSVLDEARLKFGDCVEQMSFRDGLKDMAFNVMGRKETVGLVMHASTMAMFGRPGALEEADYA